jgi:hypothetical protein
MNIFSMYYEEADGNDSRRYLGVIEAVSMGEALQKASEYWEVPSHDLVAIQYIPGSIKREESSK